MRLIILIICAVLIPEFCLSATASPSLPIPNEIDTYKPELTISEKDRWSYLVGKWFGKESTKDGGTVIWIADRNETGTYRIQFRITSMSGKVKEQVEIGEWGISGPIYFTIFKGIIIDGITTPSDSTDPYIRDAYRIIRIDAKTFEYESFNGNKYTATKVAPDFTLPELRK